MTLINSDTFKQVASFYTAENIYTIIAICMVTYGMLSMFRLISKPVTSTKEFDTTYFTLMLIIRAVPIVIGMTVLDLLY